MITALIFDCDGTLTNSMPLHYQAWRTILAEFNVEFAEKTFYDLAGMPGSNVIRHVADHLEAEQITDILDRREQLFFKSLEVIEPVSAVVDIARHNRGDMKMAVASGSIRESVEKQLVAIGIGDWFQTIVAAEDTERHKPEPDVFLEAARRLGVEPSACRVYEDSDLGLEAAERAGMEGVDVRPLYM